MRRVGAAMAVTLLGVAGCAPTPPVATGVPQAAVTPINPVGLGRVLGRDAAALVALFGPPDQDQREGPARRLQFVGPACVLDTYLFAKGSGAAVVTWMDARTPAGDDFDRASCVAALSRRAGAN